MVCNRYENTHQKLQRIYQNVQKFSNNPLPRIIKINRVNYPYNSFNNIIEINGILYKIQQEDQHSIIVNNNRSRIDNLPSISESTELAITSYLAYLAREEEVK